LTNTYFEDDLHFAAVEDDGQAYTNLSPATQ
jgi:hypothetical protein